MTLAQLQKRVISIQPAGYGHVKVTYMRYGVEKTFVSTNTLASDRINSDDAPRKIGTGRMTLKQAYVSLLNGRFMKLTKNITAPMPSITPLEVQAKM